MTSAQKPNTKNQPVKTEKSPDEAVKTFATWLGIDITQLDRPENAITKTVVGMYADRLNAGENKDSLKIEFLALFDNSPGRYALELAQSASDGAGELARDAGRRVGRTLKSDMRTEFNLGVREGMATETTDVPDLISLGKSQVDTYFARIEGDKDTKRLNKGT